MDPVRKEDAPLLPGKICCTFQPAGASCSCMQQTCRQSLCSALQAGRSRSRVLQACVQCPMRSCPLQDSASAGAPQCTALCCAGYTPEVLVALKRLRMCVMCASDPLTRDAREEHSLSLDGVTTAYRFVRQDDDGIPASFYDVLPKSPCWKYIFP